MLLLTLLTTVLMLTLHFRSRDHLLFVRALLSSSPAHPPTATLSFFTYYVLKKPEVLRKLRAELDQVLGDEPPQLTDLNKLPYLAGAPVWSPF